MSNISNTHNIKPYTIGVTKPFSGQRLATVTYKTDKDTGIKPESVCVSIPAVTEGDVVDKIEQFIPHIIALVERTQDKIIRTMHESKSSVVGDNDISVTSVLEFLAEESTGGRITKDIANAWFDSVIADPLAIALASRLGVSEEPTQEQSNKIEVMLKDFKENISALSAGNTKHSPDICVVLKKAIAFAPQDDVLASKFNARLDVMMKKVPVSIADAL